MKKINSIYHNGNLIADATDQLDTNRGFLYGDGFFESMRYENNRLVFEDAHWERLSESAAILEMDLSAIPDRDTLLSQIDELIASNNFSQPVKVRLSVYRKAEGNYTPEKNSCGYMLQVMQINNQYVLAEKGLVAGIYTEHPKAAGKFSSLKTLSSQLNVMAGIYARKQNWDEALLINPSGNYAEGISSNFFIVLDGKLLTPPLSEGCVNGVFRKQLLLIAKKSGMLCSEEIINAEKLAAASEVWFTNLIRGIQWTAKINDHKYGNKEAKKMIDILNKELRNF